MIFLTWMIALETIQNRFPQYTLNENTFRFLLKVRDYKANRKEQLNTSNYSHSHCGKAAAEI